MITLLATALLHDDVIKWKHFPRYWPFVRGIHRSPVTSPHNGKWRRALIFSLICVWINGWVNNREAGDLSRYRAHYDVIVMGWLKHFYIFCGMLHTFVGSWGELSRLISICRFFYRPLHRQARMDTGKYAFFIFFTDVPQGDKSALEILLVLNCIR